MAFVGITLLVTGCGSGPKVTAPDGINGHVVRTDRYYSQCYTNDSTTCYGRPRVFIDFFDQRGHKFYSQVVDTAGNRIDADHSYKYDRKGNLVQETTWVDLQFPRERREYRYNKQGLVTHEAWSGRYRNYTREGTFDRRRHTMNYIRRTAEGRVNYRAKHYFDRQWNHIRTIELDSLGEPYSRQDFLYDQNGNQTEIRWYGEPNTVYKFQRNRYNAKNEPIHQEIFSIFRGDTISRGVKEYAYTYDEFDNWTQQRIYLNGDLTWEIRRKIYYAKSEEP